MECQHWCVLTKSEVGEVSLLKGLTLAEADAVVERLTPHYPPGVSIRHVQNSDLTLIEKFHAGPECGTGKEVADEAE